MTVHRAIFAADVVPLERDDSYLRRSPAPAYWAQLPFHVAQRDDQSCGLASLTQVASTLAAWRARPPLSQEAMAELLGKTDWRGGVVLAELGAMAQRAIELTELEADVSTHYAADGDAAALAAFRRALAALEAGQVHVVVNFT